MASQSVVITTVRLLRRCRCGLLPCSSAMRSIGAFLSAPPACNSRHRDLLPDWRHRRGAPVQEQSSNGAARAD
eukprot:scaffold48750_cov35-Tisochrysis_lutea.AAC.3